MCHSADVATNDAAPTTIGEPVLSARGITKRFLGNTVLAGVDLDLYPGQVHGLVGENGAGKSTLMKIFAGVYQPDGGTVHLGGDPVQFSHPVQAQRAGVSTVFQEFNLLLDRSIAENIYLGREPRRRGLVDTARMHRAAAGLLEELGVQGLYPGTTIRELSVAEQQIVEIAKAVSYRARIISMDEPTAALADHEVTLLYSIIGRLSQRGIAVLYVSHRLREIFDLCTRITVLKDGALVASRNTSELTDSTLVRLMVGRPFSSFFPEPKPGTSLGPEQLRLQGAGTDYIDEVDLSVRGGEILGVAGLQGSGRTELLEAIFGITPLTRGTLLLDGEPARLTSPRRAIRNRIAMVTEDRKAKGLTMNQSLLANALGVVRAVFPGQTSTSRQSMPGVLSALEINARGLDQEVQFLSGGNQQKVVLARWLAIDPRVVLLDEPTRGIDVGAKHAVYQLIRDLAAAGVAVVMVSSELPEILGMSDRILVMRDGRPAGFVPRGSTEEEVLALATGARMAAPT